MPHAHADVLVVGAGPAGATAARTLAAAGVSTLLVDRASFPRHKPCGGALSARVIARFPYLQPALSRISTHWISRLHLEGPSGGSFDLRSDTPAALMIRRIEFDALLVALAREAGAETITGAEVVEGQQHGDVVSVGTRDGRRFSGRYLIACDGVHSVTARKLGIVDAWPRHALAIDMMEETPNANLRACDPDSLWVQYGCPAPSMNGPGSLWEGYGYVFPKRDHVNVGIGYLLSAYRKASRGPAYRSHHRFVERLKSDRIVQGHSRRECFTPFLIPVSGPRRTLSKGRVLLAGDAAGFVHGLTAEGIYYAMVSGELAATTIIQATRKRTTRFTLSRTGYSHRWREEIGRELRDSVHLQRYLFENRDRVESIVAAIARRPDLSDAALSYLTGQSTYRRLRSLVVSQNPTVLFQLFPHIFSWLRRYL